MKYKLSPLSTLPLEPRCLWLLHRVPIHTVLSFSTGHSLPPLRGSCVTSLVLDFDPSPQALLHAPYSCHSPTSQSTATNKDIHVHRIRCHHKKTKLEFWQYNTIKKAGSFCWQQKWDLSKTRFATWDKTLSNSFMPLIHWQGMEDQF